MNAFRSYAFTHKQRACTRRTAVAMTSNPLFAVVLIRALNIGLRLFLSDVLCMRIRWISDKENGRYQQ